MKEKLSIASSMSSKALLALFCLLGLQQTTAVGTPYCGRSWADAHLRCNTPCPSGTNDECLPDETCFQDLGCEQTLASRYCGPTWDEAGKKCSVPCVSGMDDTCPSGERCFQGTTCDVTFANRYCGTSWADAAAKCLTPCAANTDDVCPTGETCFSTTGCQNKRANRFCGSTWQMAADLCTQPCPNGTNDECGVANGEYCFSDTGCKGKTPKPKATFPPPGVVPPGTIPPGTIPNTAPAGAPKYPVTPSVPMICRADATSAAFLAQATLTVKQQESLCYSKRAEQTLCEGTAGCKWVKSATDAASQTSFCGSSATVASNRCQPLCPNGLDDECPVGEFCFVDTTCGQSGAVIIPPELAGAGGGGPGPANLPPKNETDTIMMCRADLTSKAATTQQDLDDAKFDKLCQSHHASETDCLSVTGCKWTQGMICKGDPASVPYQTYALDQCEATFPAVTCMKDPKTNRDVCFLTTDIDHLDEPEGYDDVKAQCAAQCDGNGGQCQCVHERLDAPGGKHIGDNFRCSGVRVLDNSCISNLQESKCTELAGCTWTLAKKDVSSYCGISEHDASSKCETTCPNGLDAECPEGELCFTATTCGDTAQAATIADSGNSGGTAKTESTSGSTSIFEDRQRAMWLTVICACVVALSL